MKATVADSFDRPLSLQDAPVPAIERVLDGSVLAPRMLFRLAEVSTVLAERSSLSVTA